jgi:hypothetical protein
MSYVWSYTGLSQFKTCPYQFYRQTIKKDVPKEDTEALRLGRAVHSMFEHRLRDGTPFPANMGAYETFARPVLQWSGMTDVEVKLGVSEDWQPAGFFERDRVAGRGAIDVLNVDGAKARVVDWKTGGKVKPDECRAQFRLNAAMVLSHYPQVRTVYGSWVHVAIRKIHDDGLELSRSDVGAVQNHVALQMGDIRRAEDTGIWPERPSGLCRGWCPVRDCKHWKPNPKVTR